MPKFKIGDEVFVAGFENTETSIQCPDCFGKTKLTVILGDESKISIDCSACERGYLGPRGTIPQYIYKPVAHARVIDGIRDEPNRFPSDEDERKVEYTFAGGYYSEEAKVFATEEEAIQHSELLRKAHEDSENKRFLTKVKDGKSWAWNASYHRRCIRDIEKNLEWHQKKLGLALSKAKAD